MRHLTINVSVSDEDADALIEQLTQIVDDEDDRGQWTRLSMRGQEWGTGGTLPIQHPVRVDSFAVE